MGWMERLGRAQREAEAKARMELSTESRESIAGCGPSPWLEDRLRACGARLIAQARGLGEYLNPPRVSILDPQGNARRPELDAGRTILQNQVFIMQALATLNDALLVLTTGKGVLEPIRKPEEPPNGDQPH